MWIVALLLDGGAISPQNAQRSRALSAVVLGPGSGMALLGSQVLPAKGTQYEEYRS
jgi:hypothetical protein